MSHRIYNLQRIQTWDEAWCLRFNRASINPAIRQLFRLISRLGDGIFWYCLMLWLLVEYRAAALLPVLHMAAAGLVCTVLYKWLKRKTHRPRPYNRNQGINCGIAPLDQFSFPSGHTLHAVAFSVVALGLLSGSRLAAAAVHRTGGRFASGARAALSQRCAGRDSDRRNHLRPVTRHLKEARRLLRTSAARPGTAQGS